jgi:hypothetical protein
MKKSEEKELKPTLYNEETFYKAFIQDLENAKKEVIIFSPYVLSARMKVLFPIFEKLVNRNIKVVHVLFSLNFLHSI